LNLQIILLVQTTHKIIPSPHTTGDFFFLFLLFVFFFVPPFACTSTESGADCACLFFKEVHEGSPARAQKETQNLDPQLYAFQQIKHDDNFSNDYMRERKKGSLR